MKAFSALLGKVLVGQIWMQINSFLSDANKARNLGCGLCFFVRLVNLVRHSRS